VHWQEHSGLWSGEKEKRAEQEGDNVATVLAVRTRGFRPTWVATSSPLPFSPGPPGNVKTITNLTPIASGGNLGAYYIARGSESAGSTDQDTARTNSPCEDAGSPRTPHFVRAATRDMM